MNKHALLLAALGLMLLSGSGEAEELARGQMVVAKDSGTGKLQTVALYDKMVALVIGVDRYADPALNLKYAVADAKGVATALTEEFAFAKVLELYNADATRAAVVGKIGELAKAAGDNDAVFIFFAGHGTQMGEEDAAVGYLVPHDGAFAEGKKSWANNISMNVIKHDWGNLIKAKHVFYVMDACYSGLMAKRGGGLSRKVTSDLAYLRNITKEPARIILTAGQAGEQVLDGGNKQGHSVFTARLLEAMRSRGDFVTAMQLAGDIKRKVAADAHDRGHTQTPDYARLTGSGDFVFIAREESPEALKAKLDAIERRVSELRAQPGSAAYVRLQKEKAELEARRLAAVKREEMHRQREREDEDRARAEIKRRAQAAELRRKLAEARAHEIAESASQMTIGAAMAEVNDFAQRMRATQKDVDADYAPLLAQLAQQKDVFEKTIDYQARLSRRKKLVEQDIPADKEKRLADFRKALAVVDGNEFMIGRADVSVSLLREGGRTETVNYDADNEVFTITVEHKGQPKKELGLSIPPDEAKELFRDWSDQTLVIRVYAVLRLDHKASPPTAASHITAVHLKRPGGQREYTAKADAPPRLMAAGKEMVMPDLGLALMPIKAGSFLMGDAPGHKVTLTKFYWLGKYEVTQGEYEKLMGKSPSKFKGAKLPVEQVSWTDALAFCAKLTDRERQAGRLPAGYEYRLPTEAEWEYACRAGTQTGYSFGDDAGKLSQYGNYCDRSNTDGFSWQDKDHDDGHDKTSPVGAYKPNAWGLYDMHGNVWEWCLDWFGDYPAGAVTDPAGPRTGSNRVYRGGGWYDNARYCRAAYRGRGDPASTISNLGFRVALAPAVQR